MNGMLVYPVCSPSDRSKFRPAKKNHVLSLNTGPPAVYSNVGTVSSVFGSLIGVTVRQSSLVNVTRNEPLNWLLPDRVIVFTMPPVKRPYSAEIPEVETVVS